MNSNRLDLFKYGNNKKRGKKVQTTRRAKRMKKADLIRSLKIRSIPIPLRRPCFDSGGVVLVVNYRLDHRTTRQFFFRMLFRLKIKHAMEWIYLYGYTESRSRSSHFSYVVFGHGNIRDNDTNRVFRLCFALDAFISRPTRVLAKSITLLSALKHA
jgi:hypothetical protein